MRWPLWRAVVVERSMEPALRPGDWLLFWRGLRPGRPLRIRPGQIVVAPHPARTDFLVIKRAARMQDGGWWLEADNPAEGMSDSRSFGTVPGELISGRMLLRYRRIRTGTGTATAEDPHPHNDGGEGPRSAG
jgi:nickel-type superoxide dismutase maturation protease